VQALTDGLRVHAAFDAIGGEATTLQATDALAPRGRAVLVGIPALTARAPISLSNMVSAEKTISGSYYGSVRPDIDFPLLADLDMEKKLDLDDLISRTYKFDEINEGFRLLVSGAVARGVIVFDYGAAGACRSCPAIQLDLRRNGQCASPSNPAGLSATAADWVRSCQPTGPDVQKEPGKAPAQKRPIRHSDAKHSAICFCPHIGGGTGHDCGVADYRNTRK
jgi:hypothetical protein